MSTPPTSSSAPIRRVVTGQAKDGTSVVASDTMVPPIVLKLDSGETVRLNAGDTLIQNGSRHAWGNPGSVPCALLTVSIDVPRKG